MKCIVWGTKNCEIDTEMRQGKEKGNSREAGEGKGEGRGRNGEWSGGRWVEREKGEGRQGKINSILTIDSIDQDREAKKTRIENERRGQIMKWRGEQRSEKQREREKEKRDNWAETNWEN
ncbi:hypothetical protein WR25_18730 [Diploscapter pachys]|uniref:Uncharacterized protein n=1 Tax=Diploscapter pachys TaxID=2018661 RepID=A0A2A2K3V5_9BILA|nr:hypothetical protein WR25_18730 [Diploscapter pachys]